MSNLFHNIAAEVAKSKFSELYLTAGEEFHVLNGSPEIMNIISKAASENKDARRILVRDYHYCNAAGSDVLFMDGVGGVVGSNGVAVEFHIKQIGKHPEVFRVLFSKVDAVKLLTDTNKKIEDLQKRVGKLETKSESTKCA